MYLKSTVIQKTLTLKFMTRKFMKKYLCMLSFSITSHVCLNAATVSEINPQIDVAAQLPFRNVDLPMERRVDDLISRLTVDEKIGQTMMNSPEIPRLGIQTFHWWNEALHGVARNGFATVFPQAIAMAAAWNPTLHEHIADVIATEARAKNNEILLKNKGSLRYEGLTIWSPNINIFRDPRWGRGQETYGEDPFLTAQLGAAFVRGLQGNDPVYLKTVATLKHYAVHSGPESERHRFDAVVSARDLRETYLPAFEYGIREARAMSIMSAYNAINGTPAPANRFLLQTVLRDEWGFSGAVVGDVDTVKDLYDLNCHNFSKDAAEASAVSIKAGNDLCSGTTYAGLSDALKRGIVTEADIEVALRRVLLLRFKLGQFDPAEKVHYRQIPISENDTPAHNDLALESARQSLVLLKNDGALPWDSKTLKTVAVIGPTADDSSALLGNYAGKPSKPVTLLTGLKNKLEPRGVRVVYEPGCPIATGFRENGAPFAVGTLLTDESKRSPGLARSVYTGPELQGPALSQETDVNVDLTWSSFAPVTGIPVTGGSVRWTGVIEAPVSGNYILSITAAGGVRLVVDDQIVIDGWKPKEEQILNAIVPFTAGKPRRVRLEYQQDKYSGRIVFGWKSQGDNHAMEQAIAAAQAADHIVMTLGITPDLEGEEMKVNIEGFTGGDRTSIMLPASQRELLAKISALGKPVTIVLTTGSPLSFDTSKANAILLAWYYGQSGGYAVAEALLGETNPAGRLPVTFYQSDKDLPPFADYSMANRTYRYFRGKPLYAFGHGLSYATFSYGLPVLSATQAKVGETIQVMIPLTNTGKCAGDEVVQVYAHHKNSSVPMPLQSLVGFQRVHMDSKESKTITIPVNVNSLRRWDEKLNQYIVDPGFYELRVGSASDAIFQHVDLEIR